MRRWPARVDRARHQAVGQPGHRERRDHRPYVLEGRAERRGRCAVGRPECRSRHSIVGIHFWLEPREPMCGSTQGRREDSGCRDLLPREKGLIVDTGRTKKPRRRADRIARAERFQNGARSHTKGGRTRSRPSTIPTGDVSFVFRRSPRSGKHLASLSAFLRRQGLISPPPRRPRPNPGSVQWVFLHSGPPYGAVLARKICTHTSSEKAGASANFLAILLSTGGPLIAP
jgi:hypothetical protein